MEEEGVRAGSAYCVGQMSVAGSKELAQYRCKGKNNSHPHYSWDSHAGITDAHASCASGQCLLTRDYK